MCTRCQERLGVRSRTFDLSFLTSHFVIVILRTNANELSEWHVLSLRTTGWFKMNDTTFFPYNLQTVQRIKLSATLNASQVLQKLFDILFINIDATEPKLWTNEKENRFFNMAAIRHCRGQTESPLQCCFSRSCRKGDPCIEQAHTGGGRWFSLAAAMAYGCHV